MQGCDARVQLDLASRLSPQVVLPGHDLCREGEAADCFWILQSGLAPVFVARSGNKIQKRTPLGLCEAANCFLDPAVRSALALLP